MALKEVVIVLTGDQYNLGFDLDFWHRIDSMIETLTN